jgi:hypothetical protein
MVPFFYKDSKIGFSYSSCCWCFCQHTLALLNTQQRRATFWEHQHGQKRHNGGVLLLRNTNSGKKFKANETKKTIFTVIDGLPYTFGVVYLCC